jgi:hypothetical protein
VKCFGVHLETKNQCFSRSFRHLETKRSLGSTDTAYPSHNYVQAAFYLRDTLGNRFRVRGGATKILKVFRSIFTYFF